MPNEIDQLSRTIGNIETLLKTSIEKQDDFSNKLDNVEKNVNKNLTTFKIEHNALVGRVNDFQKTLEEQKKILELHDRRFKPLEFVHKIILWVFTIAGFIGGLIFSGLINKLFEWF